MKNIVFGILAHVDSGKTTLSEGMLYECKSIRKLGRVDHGDTALDTNEIEKADKKYFFNMSMFSLSKEPKIYDKIPCHFADNDVLLSRKDIIDKVGITPDDDLFTRLYKLSTLEETRIEFIIKNK